MQTSVSENLLNKSELVSAIIKPTRRRKRFFNSILDGIFINLILVVIGAVWGGVTVLSGSDIEDTSLFTSVVLQNLINIILILAYYIVFEHLFGKTIGKMATNTKVVRMDGTKPTLQNIIGRTFARLIPFDIFTFLSKDPQGWHDSLANTMVVDDIALYNIEHTHKEKLEESY